MFRTITEPLFTKFQNKENTMYQYKEIYTLDFSNVNYINEVHEIIKKGLDFPDYYGKNWYAFWDCLTDMVGDPLHIELVGFEKVQSKFPRDAKIMLDILKDLKHWSNDEYADITKIEIVLGEARYEIH